MNYWTKDKLRELTIAELVTLRDNFIRKKENPALVERVLKQKCRREEAAKKDKKFHKLFQLVSSVSQVPHAEQKTLLDSMFELCLPRNSLRPEAMAYLGDRFPWYPCRRIAEEVRRRLKSAPDMHPRTPRSGSGPFLEGGRADGNKPNRWDRAKSKG